MIVRDKSKSCGIMATVAITRSPGKAKVNVKEVFLSNTFEIALS